MNRKSLSGFLVAMLLGLLLPSLASAMGDSCVGESGAAYGLCNAYCDAMDCDGDAPHASANACQKVADKYLQIVGGPVPCSETCSLLGRSDFPVFNDLVSGTIQWIGWDYDLYNEAGSPTSLSVYGENSVVSNMWYSGGVHTADDISGGPYGYTQDFESDEDWCSCRGLLEDAIGEPRRPCPDAAP